MELNNVKDDTKIKDVDLAWSIWRLISAIDLWGTIILSSSQSPHWLVVDGCMTKVNQHETPVVVKNKVVWFQVKMTETTSAKKIIDTQQAL